MQFTEPPACRPLRASEFAKFRQLAYDTFGLDLRAGKETLVAARLGELIQKAGCLSFDKYYQRVVADRTGEALIPLIDALTTNHTSFFRERAHFEFLRQTFLPAYRDRASIDIWSAACSTGEEPYSIAMCVLDYLGSPAPGKVRILATDISTRVLAAAKKAIYATERFDVVPASNLRRFWLRGERDWAGYYRAKEELRSLVEFRRLNLLEAPASVGTFPLIFCRNVMIYFDKPTQRQVIGRLSECLEPGGYLITGHAESLTGIEHGLRYVQPAVYRRAPTAGREKGKR
jgi:chemotaxis protein methyltransferase CheR